MDVSALVRMLAARIGLPPEAADGSDTIALTANGDLPLAIEPIGGEAGACFLAELGPVPTGGDGRGLKRLLQHNLEHRANSGSFLSLDARQDLVVLCRRVATDDYASFERAFESFVDEAVQLRRRFGEGDAAPARESGPDIGWALSGIRV